MKVGLSSRVLFRMASRRLSQPLDDGLVSANTNSCGAQQAGHVEIVRRP